MIKTPPTSAQFHFIGVGGIGMSALALILAHKGYYVSGSDSKISETISKLLSAGVKVFNKQIESNIKDIYKDKKNNSEIYIVVSSAIHNSNPELKAAQKVGLKILHRSEILAFLIKKYRSIVVAGTHGKTSTCTYLSTFLSLANKSPTIAIGGIVPHFQSNYHLGQGSHFIAEADESDGSLVRFKPEIGLITNIELDHTDHYQDLSSLIKTMKQYGNNCKHLIANFDCKVIKDNIKASSWFSTTRIKGMDFAAIPIEISGSGTVANYYEKERFISKIKIPIPGLHNLSNALGSISAARVEGINFLDLKIFLSKIESPKRRFDFRGFWEDRLIVDDYAHHPSEVKATISMAKLMLKSNNSLLPKSPKRIIVLFQPHRFSRTKTFLNEFAYSLLDAEEIIIAPIYTAGEKQINGISSQAISQEIKKLDPSKKVFCAREYRDIINLIKTRSNPDDLILNMGAGDLNNLWDQLQSNVDEEIYMKNNIAA